MGTYVVATRREARREGVTAETRLQGMPGVAIRGAADSDRVVIEASPQTAREIERRFGDKVIVEPEILHRRLDE